MLYLMWHEEIFFLLLCFIVVCIIISCIVIFFDNQLWYADSSQSTKSRNEKCPKYAQVGENMFLRFYDIPYFQSPSSACEFENIFHLLMNGQPHSNRLGYCQPCSWSTFSWLEVRVVVVSSAPALISSGASVLWVGYCQPSVDMQRDIALSAWTPSLLRPSNCRSGSVLIRSVLGLLCKSG